MRLRTWLAAVAAATIVVGLAGAPVSAGPTSPSAYARTVPSERTDKPAANAAQPKAPELDPKLVALADPAAVLPTDWRTSTDRAVTVSGDMNGLHVLVADEADGYRWRTAATLADNSFDTDLWIGQSCVTGSGDRAVVVYAPRTFTNSREGMNAGALVAVVDLRDGAVTRLPMRTSLAYHNPGCGVGELVTITASHESSSVTTTIVTVDTTTGKTIELPAIAGALTSAVPFGTGTAAVIDSRLVTIDANAAVRTLSTEKGLPFRLHPDRSGGLAYEVAVGTQAEVRRFDGKASRLLGTDDLSSVRLNASAGNVFVQGKDRTKVNLGGLSGWKALDLPVSAQPSTTGTLAVTETGRIDDKTRPRFDLAQPVKVSAILTASGAPATFRLVPTSGARGGPPASVPATAPPGLTAVAPPNDPTDPDRACSRPRNDPAEQAFQATSDQVEWAVDQAVKNALTVTRPINFRGSGSPSYKIQGAGGIFQRHTLMGGGTVPAQVLLGVLAQESNTMHASPHLVDGEAGNFNQGGFYGDWLDWGTADCGYGVGQITTGMARADGTSVYNETQQRAIATDYAANVAASLNALIDKWNQLFTLGIRANDGNARYVENWYLAVWAYNTGLQPNADNGNTTGCLPSPSCTDGQSPAHWGLGWLNNPSNPIYPADRTEFNGHDPEHTKHPNLWPYPEKVLGWAYTPVSRFDYQMGNWNTSYAPAVNHAFPSSQPPRMTFCVVAANQCVPNGTTDSRGNPGAGLCTLQDLHCWWHQSVSWLNGDTCATLCGTEQIAYNTGAAEPPRPDVYPARCDTTGLPTSARIIDDTTVGNPFGSCPRNWTNGGNFSLTFAQQPLGPNCSSNCVLYTSKIDFHQIGGTGFGGHFWFSHTVPDDPISRHLKVTGTWTLNAPNAWTRLWVHLPPVGAMTQQARYDITLPNGTPKFRAIPTSYEADTWVDIGVYDMRGTTNPTVSLTNFTRDGNGSVDVAWDALAFQPLDAKPANFVVALGDSYSTGEGSGDYYHVSDQYGDTPELRNACRRSPHTWSRQVQLPGTSATIGQLIDTQSAQVSYALAACSGARTWNVASTHVEGVPFVPYGGDGSHGSYGELPQLDQGLLGSDTTHVFITIGGNDAGFIDVAKACGFGPCPPEADLQNRILDQVKPRVQQIVAQIRVLAPNALIVVGGYPHLFNDGVALDGCVDAGTGICRIVSAAQLSMSAEECAMLNRISDFMVANALPSDPQHGVIGVNVIGAFNGHTIQTWTDGGYLNTITVPNVEENGSGEESDALVGMGSFHPKSEGYVLGYAVPVNAALAAQ